MKLDIVSYVVNAMANIASSGQSNQGPADQQGQALRGGEGKGGRLNDPKKCEVDSLTDVMSKAAFCLWRDNLDLYLEEFSDFAMGTNIFLKKVRLHPAADKLIVASQQHFITEIKSDGHKVGNHQLLPYMDIHKVDRELY